MASKPHYVPMPHVIQSPEVDFSLPIKYENLKGKTILITGGASGLGAAYFTLWAKHGANVMIGDINETLATELVAKTRQQTRNEDLHFIPLDATDWSSQIHFFKEAKRLSTHGGIDSVIASAGVAIDDENFALADPPDYDSMENPTAPRYKMVDVNLIGVMYTTQLAISYLSRNPGSRNCSIEQSSGPRDRHLLLISSVAGIAPPAGISVYAATKHGVMGMFRSLRVTVPTSHGVRINCLCPYFVETPMVGAAGMAILAGAAMADIQGVVHAATRLEADQSVVGRALAIVARGNRNEAASVDLQMNDSETEPRGIWDVYGHDFEQSDVFTRRIMALTNLKASQKTYFNVLGEFVTALTTPLRRLVGL